jgi:uncharacterized protein
MTRTFALVALGLVAGALSGLIGIGGGTIILPALVLLFGMSQHTAQGTTLALLIPPIGILAALAYFKQGYVDFAAAVYVGLGFIFGGYLGARVAINLSSIFLERIFGVVLLIIAVKMILAK